MTKKKISITVASRTVLMYGPEALDKTLRASCYLRHGAAARA